MVLEPEQQPLEFVLPRKGPLDALSYGMNRFVEPPLAPELGGLAVAGVLLDIWLTLPDSMSKEKAELAANASLWHPFSAQGGGSPHGRCSANSALLSYSKRQPSATQEEC
jgi:hypothetical protein